MRFIRVCTAVVAEWYDFHILHLLSWGFFNTGFAYSDRQNEVLRSNPVYYVTTTPLRLQPALGTTFVFTDVIEGN